MFLSYKLMPKSEPIPFVCNLLHRLIVNKLNNTPAIKSEYLELPIAKAGKWMLSGNLGSWKFG